MTADPTRKLKVFLCHSSHDKPAVREIYARLKTEGWIDPWLDEEKLFPGQDWDLEIEKAVEETDAAIVFLSGSSVTKEGYIQREIRSVIRKAEEKPEGTIFLLPLRLEDCSVPRSLQQWQYADFFSDKDKAYSQILRSLQIRLGYTPPKVVEISKDEVPLSYRQRIYLVHSTAAPRLFRDGVERIPVHVIVDSFSKEILDEIEEVVYHLHPSFPNPERKTSDKEQNFPLKTGAWGEFNLSVDVYIKGYKKTFYSIPLLKLSSF